MAQVHLNHLFLQSAGRASLLAMTSPSRNLAEAFQKSAGLTMDRRSTTSCNRDYVGIFPLRIIPLPLDRTSARRTAYKTFDKHRTLVSFHTQWFANHTGHAPPGLAAHVVMQLAKVQNQATSRFPVHKNNNTNITGHSCCVKWAGTNTSMRNTMETSTVYSAQAVCTPYIVNCGTDLTVPVTVTAKI